MKNKTIFITAIDTDAGKTVFTGLLARFLNLNGKKVITQKLVQTGCERTSEDIMKHREIMGLPVLEIDKDGTTCPYVFKYPASPHLASEMENKEIDLELIATATKKLEASFDYVLLEGAGGLHVPMNKKIKIIDYIEEKNYPVILVTNAKLGSINHTLLSLEAIKRRNLNLLAVAFNHFNPGSDIILKDTKEILRNHSELYFPKSKFIEYKSEIMTEFKEIQSIF